MKAQLRRLGLGHDKRRSFATIDPDYYKWTQWIFLQIFNSWYDNDADEGPPDRRAGRAVRDAVSARRRTARARGAS